MLVLSCTAPPANTGSRRIALHVHGAQLTPRPVDKRLTWASRGTALRGRFYHCNTAQGDARLQHLRQRFLDSRAELRLDLLRIQVGARLYDKSAALDADGRA